MFFKSYLPKQYLAAAIVASLLQGVVTATPVFAEAVTKSEATVTQEVTTTPDTTVTQEAASTQEPMQSEAAATSVTTAAHADIAEQDVIDHSAESKPIQNEFLKEGEGIPGTEVPYQNERKLSSAEWKEIDQLEKTHMDVQRFTHTEDHYEPWALLLLALLLLSLLMDYTLLRHIP